VALHALRGQQAAQPGGALALRFRQPERQDQKTGRRVSAEQGVDAAGQRPARNAVERPEGL